MLTKSFLRDIINKLTDVRTEYGMERWLSWSKAHDWKSCKDFKSFEGSNPSLSAKQKRLVLWTGRFCFVVDRGGIRTSRPNKQSGGLFVGEGFSAEKRIPHRWFDESGEGRRVRTLRAMNTPYGSRRTKAGRIPPPEKQKFAKGSLV